jgi:hypothetical protein
MTISRLENACKPLILLGLQKNIKIISTQLLTWLIISVILQLEQRRGHKEIRKRVPNQSSEKSFQHSRKKDASDLLKTVKEFERSNDL